MNNLTYLLTYIVLYYIVYCQRYLINNFCFCSTFMLLFAKRGSSVSEKYGD